MGIKSTHLITREVALEVITRELEYAKDEELEEMLEAFPQSYFRNYRIVPDNVIEENSKQEFPTFTIESVYEFGERNYFEK